MTEFRSCIRCGSKTTFVNKKGRAQWYNHNGWHCQKCNNNLFHNPKYKPITNKRKIWFKDKQIYLEESPKTGRCSECGKQVGDLYLNKWGVVDTIKTTHMHHVEYDENNPLAHTLELCISCHIRESWLLGQFGDKTSYNKNGFIQRIYRILSSI